ncbi:MAG: hypothetical protein A2Y73_08490 [Chloroflexi bacterium RBG_13_56_8]|nr:MAG: hypothetical protein A2Y73_08490 [Chloroflexi bacterium RBG_13_56_8]
MGAGGGFLLMPVLLLVYPQARSETLTSISLAVVFLNALSGSWAYARMQRIDYRSGLIFAAATIPGAILGTLTTDLIPRRTFNTVFGVLMIAGAAYLLFRKANESKASEKSGSCIMTRHLVEKDGTAHTFSYDPRIGVGLSLFVGYVSSLLGIGGGIIHVPALARLLNFPVHIACATSHFILAIMALTGTIVHIVAGSFSQGGVTQTILLGIGVLLGAQVGAALSSRVRGVWILRALAVALAFVGIRILILAL